MSIWLHLPSGDTCGIVVVAVCDGLCRMQGEVSEDAELNDADIFEDVRKPQIL